MSAELYEKMVEINRIDQAIFEAENEVEKGASLIPLEEARKQLDAKYFK